MVAHQGADERFDQLIAKAQRGDSAAFEKLLKLQIPQIRRFARGFCKNQADADDLAQEALVRVYQALSTYRFDAEFSTWVFRIVRNKAIDHSRKQQRHRRNVNEAGEQTRQDTTHAAAHNASAEDMQLRREHNARLWEQIQQLPTRFRTVLILCEIEELPYAQVAAIENVPIGTVRSRLARAKKKLAKQ